MHLGSIMTRHARYRPDHPAVVFEDNRLTYRQFNRRINRLANTLLTRGIRKGDRVAILLPNCLELLEVYWAAAKSGAVAVPLSTLLRPRAMAALLKDAGASMLITNSGFVEPFETVRRQLPEIETGGVLLTDSNDTPGYLGYYALTAEASEQEPVCEEIRGSDPFNIMYSSGTTGQPKGIVHTHDIRIAYGTSFAAAYRMTPEAVTMHAGAIVFNGAFVDMMPTFFVGATYILLSQFEPESYIETVARERVTHVMVVPAQVIALLDAPKFSARSLSSLEMILSLGAPLLRKHKEALNRALPERFYELYGLTEGFVTVLDKLDSPAKPDSVGVPPPLFEMRILDENGEDLPPGEVGEICGKGPILMPGYYGRPDLTEEAVIDGWLHSGDMGYVDTDGFLYLVDRKKDMIISGGVNVYPRDIEEVVVRHEAVREAAVFGVPDEKWGESPLAAVVLHEPGTVSGDELREWINERVEAKFQRVAAVAIMEDFPRNVAGKTLKREMRAAYWKDRP